MPTTAKYGLPFPAGSSPNQVPADMGALAAAIDAAMAGAAHGTLAARPSAGKYGLFYYADDTSDLFFDTGSAWKYVLRGSIPRVKLTRAANQTIASATLTTIIFDTEVIDSDNMHDPAVNPSRLTIRTAGSYRFVGRVQWQANAAQQQHSMLLIKNGINQVEYDTSSNRPGQVDANFVDTWDDCVAGDYYELQVIQATGVAQDLIAVASYLPRFEAIRTGQGG